MTTIHDVPLAIYATGFVFAWLWFLKLHICRPPGASRPHWHHATIGDLFQATLCGLLWPMLAIFLLWVGPDDN